MWLPGIDAFYEGNVSESHLQQGFFNFHLVEPLGVSSCAGLALFCWPPYFMFLAPSAVPTASRCSVNGGGKRGWS